MTQPDAPRSSVLENAFFFASLSCQQNAESTAGTIPAFNLLSSERTGVRQKL